MGVDFVVGKDGGLGFEYLRRETESTGISRPHAFFRACKRRTFIKDGGEEYRTRVRCFLPQLQFTQFSPADVIRKVSY